MKKKAVDVVKWITGAITEGRDVSKYLREGQRRGREGVEESVRRDKEGEEGSQREGGVIFFSVTPSQ